jgi:hypothetical protein
MVPDFYFFSVPDPDPYVFDPSGSGSLIYGTDP